MGHVPIPPGTLGARGTGTRMGTSCGHGPRGMGQGGSGVTRGSPSWEHGGELASKGTRGDIGQPSNTSLAVL